MSNYFQDKLPSSVQKRGEIQVVKTPVVLTSMILDGFPIDVWSQKDKRWLCPADKTGVFPLGVYVRLMKGLAYVIPDWEDRRRWIVGEMIWSLCPTDACALVVRRNYLGKVWGSMRKFDSLEGNVLAANFLDASIHKGAMMVKDNAGKSKYVVMHNVVGNPPYQDNSKANDPKNIYPAFVLKAMELKPEYMSMVIPARWTVGSGKGAQEFLDTMLATKKISRMVVETDSSRWFPDVSIMGGVCTIFLDAKHNSTVIEVNGSKQDLKNEDVIITDLVGLGIKSKVLGKVPKTFSEVMLGGAPFEIRSSHKDWADSARGSYVCHNSGKGDAPKTTFISKSLVKKNVDCIGKYKTCIAAGYGSAGTSNPFVVEPDHIVSQSYLVMGCFDSESEAANAAAFFRTHLAQFLISLLKNTQNLAKRAFKYLPFLDFTRSYIDADLYTMFDLSAEEIAHIETITKDFPIFRSTKNQP